ncbi:hypothetical protein K504DRAFT_458023 [Pleomassaria siparia CBS 279.74]|uniref:Uncharacterized protein n=1 Tax=Pleomassaria siparia CBS 279.74 TaxID=1314801 RepID=A0A6G1K4Y8_9PLEO|nr:hypothetical protein K504DRAFT_458023 [Pleomassaria siparia CBS 279.74]
MGAATSNPSSVVPVVAFISANAHPIRIPSASHPHPLCTVTVASVATSNGPLQDLLSFAIIKVNNYQCRACSLVSHSSVRGISIAFPLC